MMFQHLNIIKLSFSKSPDWALPECTLKNNFKKLLIFSNQKRVFSDLGEGVLNNAWQGYNSTLFAYGQTGSGKSWSVIGYGANKGIVPILAEKLFAGITDKKEATSFEVKFSMMEIYNEVATDLLNINPNKKKREGLKIRQHPKKGFYGKIQLQIPYGGTISAIKKQLWCKHWATIGTQKYSNVNQTVYQCGWGKG